MSRPVQELAAIIRQHKTSFIAKHQPLKQHLSVLNALEKCRTAALGGHVDGCDKCGHLRISYNSCRNRHCPKCQNTNKERWIMARQQQLLPVSYFHVVFTLPQELNTWCMHYPKQMYDLLFAASQKTIAAFAADEKHLGAMPGMISVLHTWGQNLSLHPHVHLIIPGGGIASSGCWKNVKHKGQYLFSVKAMSVVFKNKYMEGFLKLLKEENLPTGQAGKNIEPSLRETLYNKSWVVYAKAPFGGPAQVIEYLGRYTHKVAISNHRIVSIDDDKVSFLYKDYADNSKQKIMSLEATEFLRRFCLHILPPGFRKIRYYGFMATVHSALLQVQQKEMGILPSPQGGEGPGMRIKKISWKVIAKQKLNYDADLCPCCKKGKMITLFHFKANAPPDAESLQSMIELLKARLTGANKKNEAGQGKTA